MAKHAAGKTSTAPKKGQKAAGDGENVAGYFRAIFSEYPKLLKGRSNEELLKRWLVDHPDEKEVPDRIKGILSNTKGILRKKLRKKPGRKKTEEQSTEPVAVQEAAPPAAQRGLENLEEQIDDSLSFAKNLDREGLESVIHLLRRARNEVVWKLGQ